MKYIVIYDACVFYPSAVRDLLMELAMPGKDLFQAKWSEEIESEWLRNLISNRPDLDANKLKNTAKIMREVVPDCIVRNYEPLMHGIVLPDPKDVHVLAAAIRAKAQAIITFNLKDFPPDILDQFDIEATHPDTFLINQYDLSMGKVLDAVKNIRSRLKNPLKSPEEYIDRLFVEKLTAFGDCLKEFQHLI
ncbi:MAG: PIN domain-containing protein [Pseudomonadota bacterium]